MKELTSKDYKLLKSLCGLSQKSMRKTLLSYLRSKYKEIYHSGDFIMAIGDIPIALVAHMDTVFDTPPKNIYYDKDQGVLWSPEGLGADDRAGIFLILKILQAGYNPTVIFTADEEIGAVGANALIENFKMPPTAINYIIQLDRRGTNDCVFYNCDNEKFVNYIERFGFCENFGTFSDISIICPDWGIAGVNLSVGYENEHSYIETLHIAPMLQTLNRVIKMLQEKDIPSFDYIPSEKVYSWWSSTKYGNDIEEEKYVCNKCGKAFSDYNVVPCKDEYENIKFYCPDCCVDRVYWCDECGKAFEINEYNKNDKVCLNCKNKTKGGNNAVRRRSEAV